MPREHIPTSRVVRSATIGRLAAGQAVKQFGTRAANIARGADASEAALARRQIETAEQIVAVLGTMKGAAMKLGQVMSFLDVGLVPEEYREEFQRKLAELRDAAPKVSFKEMRKVIESEFEDPIDEVFADFDTEPIAAASIGQVYRARLRDGRDVAVKVQYPGVASAVRADMKNLGMIMRLLSRMAPGLDVQEIAEEIRLRIDEELDYELEAANQRAMSRIFRGHPFVFVPEVVGSLSRERVLVSEFVQGTGFEELKGADAATRDRIAEIIFRFYFGCMYRHHQFSGDPHPGNFMLLADGRVAFIDFGLYKRLPARIAEYELETARLGITKQGEALIAHLHAGGFLPEPDRYTPEQILQQFEDVTWWYTVDGVVELTPEIATQVVIDMSDPRSRHYAQMRHENLPADHLFGRRTETLTLAVMSQLRAKGNWHRIAREWVFDDPPSTELGREEAAFYGTKPPGSGAGSSSPAPRSAARP
ncbi:MAG TPA: AarF/ABC1/UbiB kinase family protein [Solirubrobacteraceae bacterium]|jgi:predicted unusual protein kinase regulating ubiquinone biosynthesis (AarF/ABC1/UbiB family)